MKTADFLLETERLGLREMTQADFPVLCAMLQDIDVMYAWEHAFSDSEVRAWIDRRQAAYRRDGYSHWLAVDRKSGAPVGQIGLLNEEIEGRIHLGIGWILIRKYWHMGYAVEGAKRCIEYAFDLLRAPYVIADIRPMNTASVRVARQLGMVCCGEYDKIVNHAVMPHRIYYVPNPLLIGRTAPDFSAPSDPAQPSPR